MIKKYKIFYKLSTGIFYVFEKWDVISEGYLNNIYICMNTTKLGTW